METTTHPIAVDPTYGYRRLDPVPRSEELSAFYESQYYDLLRKGGRAPELRRLMEGGVAADRERRWLREGMYTDIVEVLEELGAGSELLEIGCGTGDFLVFAREKGFSVTGIEPASEAVKVAQSYGIKAHAASLEAYQQLPGTTAACDTVVLLNVLEHVPDPQATLRACFQLLRSGGLVGIRVPNDFTAIQEAALARVGGRPWWIAVPDHINYFTFETLGRLLVGMGFEVVYRQGDFPMEMFLLMGDNYVGNPEVGSQCHAKRVSFDLALPPVVRRRYYQALAQAGLGRDCLIFARKRS